ncbi:MAG: hypothetical protein PHZ19_03340 [Candidatus Thermoplasmatota archaeon]|nr:hypothetical protein [Candidatus Thermoplasmatota archaeon]
MVRIKEIIGNVASQHDFRDLRGFLNASFDEIAKNYHLDGSKFQQRAKL